MQRLALDLEAVAKDGGGSDAALLVQGMVEELPRLTEALGAFEG